MYLISQTECSRARQLMFSFAVIHAEMPVNEPGKPEPRGLQLWVDLPKQYKMAEPSYQDLEPEK